MDEKIKTGLLTVIKRYNVRTLSKVDDSLYCVSGVSEGNAKSAISGIEHVLPGNTCLCMTEDRIREVLPDAQTVYTDGTWIGIIESQGEGTL